MICSEPKICDCTIRDGGLVNNSHFSMETVRNIYKAVCDSGVDIVELGYKNSKKLLCSKHYGCWRFYDEDILRQATGGVKTTTQIAIMQDAHKADAEDLLRKEESIIDIIRIATYVKDIDKAILLENSARDKGYKTTINIMAISKVDDRELEETLQRIYEETNVIACYIVDSFGSFHFEDIDHYFDLFRKQLKEIAIGIHCHNQQQLAFSNTIQAMNKGATYLDASLYGLGRAAGNCPIELLAGYFRKPKLDILPLINVIGKEIIPLKKK